MGHALSGAFSNRSHKCFGIEGSDCPRRYGVYPGHCLPGCGCLATPNPVGVSQSPVVSLHAAPCAHNPQQGLQGAVSQHVCGTDHMPRSGWARLTLIFVHSTVPWQLWGSAPTLPGLLTWQLLVGMRPQCTRGNCQS